MSAKKIKTLDYKTLSSGSKENGASGDAALKPAKTNKTEALQSLENSKKKFEEKSAEVPPVRRSGNATRKPEENELLHNPRAPRREHSPTPESPAPETPAPAAPPENPAESQPTYAEQKKIDKKQKSIDRDWRLLNGDRWLARNGHTLTYIGIFLFTLAVYFRPYELIPALSGFKSIALIIAVATLAVYLPAQLANEGTLTAFSTEIKCVLFMIGWAVLLIPISKDPGLAWATLNDTFIKVVAIFIVMVNTLRTKARLKGLMWLSIGIGVMLSYQALDLYRRGEFRVEGYRVSVDFGGMFGNPNDMAIHLVIFAPVAFVLGLASKNTFSKIVYFSSAALMVAGNMVTLSRGGFLGLIAVGAVLAWKLGKKQRFKVVLVSSVLGLLLIAFAPGNYGLRILSIFIPALDPVGSSDQRMELLKQSILVSIRNPQGIGIGNFPVVGVHNLETHNAFTQVSAELGLLALAAYVILMVSPIRKLGAIERRMFSAHEESSWIYYLSIGLQASIVGYMVSSFFGPVAYNWYVYYPIAYAVCLRRIYRIDHQEKGVETGSQGSLLNYFKLQKA